MPKITLFAVGRMKPGPQLDLVNDYRKRLTWDLKIQELDARDAAAEHTALTRALAPDLPLFLLDERGKPLSSTGLAQTIQTHFNQGHAHLQFAIGGADGLNDELRARATHLISFGTATWPHMLVRVMLMEQLYRAQQIIAGHPYHRA